MRRAETFPCKYAVRAARRRWGVGLAAAALMVSLGQAQAAAVTELEGFGDIAARLLPAVVNISTTQTIKPDKGSSDDDDNNGPVPPGSPFEQFFKNFLQRHGQPGGARPQAQARKATLLGSGFVVDAKGLIVTNNHVIADADEITVILQDDTNIKAELVGRDEKTDLAVLRVKTDHALAAVPFGDSDKTRVGDWVLAVGNPFGLGGTLTAGIISARSREINNNNGPYDDFLQTDAAINKGNSGGPLFNLDGEVIGINSAIFSPSGGSIGIGFAIPADLARTIVGQLEQYGHVRRGWLGARTQSVDGEVAKALGLDRARGALVAEVMEKSPALQSGLQPGDVILGVDWQAGLRYPPSAAHRRGFADRQAGQILPLAQASGEGRRCEAERARRERADADGLARQVGYQARHADEPDQGPGLVIAQATPELKEKYQLGENAAVVVTSVAKGSPAGEKDAEAGRRDRRGRPGRGQEPERHPAQDRRGQEGRAQDRAAAGRSGRRAALRRRSHRHWLIARSALAAGNAPCPLSPRSVRGEDLRPVRNR